MSEIVLRAQGIGGALELDGAVLRIVRKGVGAFMLHGLKGDKEIGLRSITSVQFKKPSFVANGYLQVTFPGALEAKQGIFEATKDENTVMFRASHLPAFEALRDELRRRMGAG